MSLILALILAPILIGLILLAIREEAPRRIVVIAAVIAAVVGSFALAIMPLPDVSHLPFDGHWVHWAMVPIEVAMALYILYVGIRWRRPLLVLLVLAQSALMGWLEFAPAAATTTAAATVHAPYLLVDKFSVILGFINGIVGGGIFVYATGYMKAYHLHSHPEYPDRRPLFFSVLFIFMGAMFGISFSNDLGWLFFFWEITTLCSFILIGYTQTAEARNNALRALTMNMVGGVAFAAAIVWLRQHTGASDLQSLLAANKSVALLPAALLCLAGITKSAQLPFSSWLLGAMVAPTPVSALLHSSTMVKAGVYLILRMAPLICHTQVGLMVAMIGAVTFVIASMAAITARDAKRLLAWSTVANLGLIGLCGGIGTDPALWAGMLLVIFHAVAKCLLFLCVGVVENQIHSRDIDSMSGLSLRMPRVAIAMLIGMAGMFLAPFGMLVSKWAVLKAVVDAYPIMSVFIAFGSSATLFFWVKWMGKLLQVSGTPEMVKREFHWTEGAAIFNLSGAVFMCCALFPVISSYYIEPYVLSIYGHSTSLGANNILLMTIMMSLVLLFPLSFINYGRGVKVVDAYLAGANVESHGGGGSSVNFIGSAGQVTASQSNNYYLENQLSERWLSGFGVICCAMFLAVMLWMAYR